jgi:phosphopantothenoylcysteine decarboxylase/phosphopantothenate--cysteine ligase
VTFSNGRLAGTTVALCVTGSIAAYKAATLARLLRKEGARVVPVMTESARRFLGASTLSGITGEEVLVDMWTSSAGEIHVSLGAAADAIVIAPATADVLARLAQGRASDLVTALVLCARADGHVLVAPAMHPRMWENPATKRNVKKLTKHGRIEVVGPAVGQVASGDEGAGRMSEPEEILEAVVLALTPKDMEGLSIVVTAGPTLEDMDPVRFLGNRSSGKMGFAIAARAAARGAKTTLVAGPVQLATPARVVRVDVRSALEMQAALKKVASCDAIVMAAAVADHRFAKTSETKLKKGAETESLEMVRNPDLLAEVGAMRAARKELRPILVGFALETGARAQIVAEARRKLREKKVDVVVANEARLAFGGDDNEISFVTENRDERLPRATKVDLADALLDRIKSLLG